VKAYAIFNCPEMNLSSSGTQVLEMSYYWGWPLPGRAYYGEVSNYVYNLVNFGGSSSAPINEQKSMAGFERWNIPFQWGVVVKCGIGWLYTVEPGREWDLGHIYNPKAYPHPSGDPRGSANVMFPDWHVAKADMEKVGQVNEWLYPKVFYVKP
jgi:prepilin-type processing-associated H-X9-DG protein